MNFIMKILAVSVLLVAMMALALGTEAPPEAEAAPVTEAPVQEDEDYADASSNEETESEDEDGEEAESTEGEKKHEVAKRSLCRCGWSRYGRTCYRYFAYRRTWAQAQKHCKALGGNLASVHNRYEDIRIRAWARQRPAWIGFSDAQQERYWFWIDGTRYNYQNWCRKQPDNAGRRQHCATNKWGGRKCWDDVSCLARLPYVCAQRRR